MSRTAIYKHLVSTNSGSTQTLVWITITVVLALMIIRFWVGTTLELVGDEAYYWVWSKTPGVGYFDHPPMVAWWIALGRALFGDTEIGVRFVGIASYAAVSCLTYATAIGLFGDRRRALHAVIWLQITMSFAVLGVVMSPDTPLLLFWSLTLFALVKIGRTGNGRWWSVVGLGAGLALLSKYAGFLIGIGILVWLFATPSQRHWFRRFELYAGGAIAALVFAPNLLWNAQNGWPSFVKQFGRIGSGNFAPDHIAEYLGAQIGLLTPHVFLFAVIAIGVAMKRTFISRDWRWSLLVSMIVPPLLIFLQHALHERVEANWTAMLVPLAVIAAVEIAYGTAAHPLPKWLKIVRRHAFPVGLVLTFVVYAQALVGPVPIAGTADPTSRLKGWRVLAQEIDRVVARSNAQFITTTDYGLNALLTFYGDTAVPVVQLNHPFRYHMLDTPKADALIGLAGIYVHRGGAPSAQRLEGFQSALGTFELCCALIRRRPDGLPIRQYTLFTVGHTAQ